MTIRGTLATTFLVVAVASVVAIISLGSDSSSDMHDDDKAKTGAEEDHSCQEENSNTNEIGEVRDSSEEMTTPTNQREPSTEENVSRTEILKSVDSCNTDESPPSTPLKKTTAKGKKWRDRLSAKKQLKLKHHQKNRSAELRNDIIRAE